MGIGKDASAMSELSSKPMVSPLQKSITGARVAIVHPLLAHYRVPVFDLLARSTGIDLTVICDMHPTGSLKGARPTEAFRCEHAPQYKLGPMISHPAMLAAATSGRFDAVVLTWNVRLLELIPALLACRARGTASVLWGHGYSKSDSIMRRTLRRRMVSLADATLLYGRMEQERLQAAGYQRTFVAPNAIDQSAIAAATVEWTADKERLRSWQKERGVDDGRLVVFISRIEPDKRVDLLLDAFRLAQQKVPGLRLAIIGGGSGLEPARAYAAELGVASSTTFTGPIYEERDIAPWCLSAGCFAYPEAIGLSIQHAFGYGLPVVTNDCLASHNPEIEALEPGVNGLLYARGDATAFADSILRILDGARSGEQWRRAALDTVNRAGGYSLESMVAGFAKSLAFALKRQGRRVVGQ
jgi:glycosyltransferase involved in cell wall biosynthesis